MRTFNRIPEKLPLRRPPPKKVPANPPGLQIVLIFHGRATLRRPQAVKGRNIHSSGHRVFRTPCFPDAVFWRKTCVQGGVRAGRGGIPRLEGPSASGSALPQNKQGQRLLPLSLFALI